MPIWTFSEEIEATLITSVGSLTAALVAGVLGFLAQRSARRTREEITNNHPRNIRDDLDQQFDTLNHRFDGVEIDIRDMRRDLGRQVDATAALAERVHDIEANTPKPAR